MTNAVRLNNIEHKTLRINTKNQSKLGDNVTSTLTFPSEFIEIQREYPILFSKNPSTGEFQSVVLLGLEKDENLFLKRGKWHASYIPAVIRKGPFLIGFEQENVNGEQVNNAVIYVNMDNPRVSICEDSGNDESKEGHTCEKKDKGEALFLNNGEQSPYLEQVSQALAVINEGTQISKSMFAAFCEYDLLEVVNLDIKLNNSQQISLSGNYTIHREKLAQLDGVALEKLSSAGFLPLAYAVIASLANVQKLIDAKNSSL